MQVGYHTDELTAPTESERDRADERKAAIATILAQVETLVRVPPNTVS